MRNVLLLLAFAALVAGCGVNPVAPEDSRTLQPADCMTHDGQPC